MATGTREAILARLAVVLLAIDGVEAVARNAPDVPGVKRPAILLHDGNEQARENRQETGRSRGYAAIMDMTPIIVLLLNANNEQAGPLANQYLAAIQQAAMSDPELLALLANEMLRYQSATLIPIEAKEAREARMEIEIVFTYIFQLQPI